MLRGFARHHLDAGPGRHSRLATAAGASPVERISGYRWATLALPWDILAIAARLDKPPLRNTLCRPNLLSNLPIALGPDQWAENHLHGAAASEYAWVWVGLMISAYRGELDLSSLPTDPAVPGGGPEQFRRLLYEAAICRLVIAYCRSSDAALATIAQDLPARLRAHWLEVLRTWSRPGLGSPRANARALCVDGVEELVRGGRPRSGVSALRDLLDLDPVAQLLGVVAAPPATSDTEAEQRAANVHAEHAFLHLALRDAEREKEAPVLSVLALRYIRLFCWVYRFVVQEPSVAGLGWFSRHYARIDALAKPIEAIRAQAAASLDGEHLRLESLELRTTPTRPLQKLRQLGEVFGSPGTTQSASARKARERFPFAGSAGLVFHFLRAPAARPDWHRGWYEKNRALAEGLADVLTKGRKEELKMFWGVDAANDELAVPTWVEAPLFWTIWKQIRSSRRLGLTLHAGEEYRADLEGLRRVDMAIWLAERLGKMAKRQPRLRLGHGLALLEQGCNANGEREVFLQPAFERLCDLWWALGLLASGRVVQEQTIARSMQMEVAGLSRILRLDQLPTAPHEEEALVAWVMTLLDRLHNPQEILHVFGRASYRRQRNDPLAALLSSGSRAERARLPVEAVVDAPIRELIDLARTAVRARAAATSKLAIECCPSSNLVVADHDSLQRHPMHLEQNRDLRLTVNADDPLTFATSLADERAYALAGAMKSDIPLPDAAKRLEKWRRTGMNVRFKGT